MNSLSEGYKRAVDQIVVVWQKSDFSAVKMHFWPKKHFSAKRKNGRFSQILARTGSVVIVGHFLMTRTVPPNFVENGPKLRVLITENGEWPKTAKNRGEPQKMTDCSETEFFLGVVRMGKL